MEQITIDAFLQESFDFLIVGGGTAGLVLAARLSEQDHVRVGVIEAGNSKLGVPKVDLPSGIGMMIKNPHDRDFQSVPQVSYHLVYAQTMTNEPFSPEKYPKSGIPLAKRKDAGRL